MRNSILLIILVFIFSCKKEEPITEHELIHESQIGKWSVVRSRPGIFSTETEFFDMELLPDHSMKILDYDYIGFFIYQYWTTSIDESEIKFYYEHEDGRVEHSFIYKITKKDNNNQEWQFNFDDDIYRLRVTRIE